MVKRTRESVDKPSKKLKLETNHTIYINNLNDKINTNTLKHNLYLLCLAYGDVIDIIIKPKSKKMRGQAHVIFSSSDEAAMALKKLKDMVFFSKPMKVDYSRKVSHIIRQSEIE
ncbi:U2 small nuclear ribonucleoprotein B'' [[Candida] jaroonii]|uniref:U2 small nuclear ribonucleoprotein B n=1 Tax=[Candida] jaroonii TaxID=467808 RepID=A0ACA9YAD7_9ASCO|nr:U2 small nuclear ribonucleoprotein B'' [[Candida] jaroonii]